LLHLREETDHMQKKYLFLIPLLLHIIAWFALKPVWPFSDDYWYAFHAHNFLNGHLNLNYNHFQNRFGVYLPTSIIFFFFGIHPYTIALWPLLASCLTITLVWLFLKKTTNSNVALTSAFLIAVNPLQITYSIALFPDIIEAFFCLVAVLTLYHGRRQKQEKKIYPFLFILSLFLGFLTKETVLLITPFLLTVFFYDLYKKQNTLFWKRAIFMGICTTLLYFTSYFLITGNPFFRINGSVQTYTNNEFFNKADAIYLKKTYSSNIFRWFDEQLGYIFILITGLFSLFVLTKRSFGQLYFFISIYVITLLIAFTVLFYSTKYGMLFSRDRIWIFLVVPLSILSANLIIEGKNKYHYYLIAAFTFLFIYNYYTVSHNRGLLFGSFLFIALFSLYLMRKNKSWSLILLAPFFLLSTYFVYCNSNYRIALLQAGDLIKNQIEELNGYGKKNVLCSVDFSENHIIYNGFREYSNLNFYPFRKYDSLYRVPNLYVIVNTEKDTIPDFILKNPKIWGRQYDSGKLLIYKKTE
jgi:4-amino-4-deoxy-L-arabinose transferase-like glycosyltransferase